jgi:hypothetical protein
MNEAKAFWLLSIALTACAGGNAQQPATRTSEHAALKSAIRSPSRLGPPSRRGLSLRRIDRPAATEPQQALY